MFGGFRFLLSLMVVWYHLVDWRFSGPVAVFGFYVVSGYLMTKVINEIYGDGIGGFNRYIANRALRIYPMYWAAVGLSAVVLTLMPELAGQVSVNYQIPDDLLVDLLIFGHRAYTPSMMPPAWSLAVELFVYIAMGALLSRRPLITVIWFVAGIEIVVAAAIIGGYPFRWFFTSLAASSLPFATGAMIYHFGGRLRVPAGVALPAVVGIVLAGLFMPRAFGMTGGIYLGLALAAVAVAGLSRLPKTRIDDVFGDLA
jgi:peptidoglycan/LPS O-acetylase OafA/YrhL